MQQLLKAFMMEKVCHISMLTFLHLLIKVVKVRLAVMVRTTAALVISHLLQMKTEADSTQRSTQEDNRNREFW